MFALVEFSAEKGDDGSTACEVVPFSWISDDEKFCAWPGQKSFKQAFKKVVDPPAEWRKVPVILKYISVDLLEVRKKQINFLEESNLESEAESHSQGINLRKRPDPVNPSLNQDMDSEDEIVTPNLSKKSKPGLIKHPVIDMDGFDSNSFSQLSSSSTSPSNKIVTLMTDFPNDSSSSSTLPPPPLSSVSSPETGNTIILHVPIDFPRLVLKKIECLTRAVENLQREVRELKFSPLSSTIDTTGVPAVPAETRDRLDIIEAYVKASEGNSNKMAVFLSKTGGSTAKDATDRVLTYLLKDELAMEFSWAGVKRANSQKEGFSSLKIMLVVVDAVQMLVPSATKLDVENHIKNWLKYAKQRLEGTKPKVALANPLNAELQ